MEVRRCVNCMEELGALGDPICPHCGYDQQKEQENPYGLRRNTILKGRYLVGNMLGQGGFGITYIGFDLVLNIKVAIKEYFPMGSVSRDRSRSNRLLWGTAQNSQEQWRAGCESFLKEARRMAKIDTIPEIVRVRDTFLENQTAYIVMDFVEGRTLKDRIMKEGTMAFPDCLSLLWPLMESLDKVHQQGLIHRDISPDNIMIQKDGSVRLLDLGAAKDMSAAPQGASQLVTKRGFSPMEQYMETGKVGAWTDVYALCATIYYCITGKVVPEALERLMEDKLSLDVPVKKPLSREQKEALLAGLAVKPEERIQTVSELLSALAGEGGEEKYRQRSQDLRGLGGKGADGRTTAGKKGGKRWWLLAAAVACAAVVLVAVLGWEKPRVEYLGNSASNIYNDGGYLMIPGEYEYFLDKDFNLYACEYDTEDQIFYVDQGTLVKEDAAYINLGEDKVYFRHTEGGRDSVWRMELDGSGAEQLFEANSITMLTYAMLTDGSEMLYFLDATEGGEVQALCRYDLASGEQEAVLEDTVGWYNLYGEYIYYTDIEETRILLCRCGLDGEDTEILDDSEAYLSGFIEDGEIYLYSLNEEDAIVICDLEGNKTGGLYGLDTDMTNYTFAYGNGWIYYDSAADQSVHRVRANGTADEVVMEDTFAVSVCFSEDNLWVLEGRKGEEEAIRSGVSFSYKDGDGRIALGNTGVTDAGLEYEIGAEGVTLTGYSGESNHILIPYTIDGMPVIDWDVEIFPPDAQLYAYALEEEFQYEETEGGAVITGYNGEGLGEISRIAIPDMLGGMPVVAIGEYAFEDTELCGIMLPDTVKEIRGDAFSSADNLDYVRISQSLEYIGSWAFSFNYGLRQIELPETLRELDDWAFYSSALESVVIPAGTESVGTGAFKNCGNLTSVLMPQSCAYEEDSFEGIPGSAISFY